MEQRKRARAIIIFDEALISMYREFNGKSFYVFPGGGVENNETLEECIVREVMEEFGIEIEPINKVYEYESEKSFETFFVCKWLGGEFGTGKGEEFQPEGKNGVYIPKLIKISEIPSLPLMPPEVAFAMFKDFSANGPKIRKDVLKIKV